MEAWLLVAIEALRGRIAACACVGALLPSDAPRCKHSPWGPPAGWAIDGCPGNGRPCWPCH